MNKVGIYYAYWTQNWETHFVPFVEKAKARGFDILEVDSVAHLPKVERKRLRDAALNADIELTFSAALAPAYDIASEEPTVRRQGIAFLQNQARMLRDMEAKQLGGVICGCWLERKALSESEKYLYLDRSVESMQEVMKVVEDCGVVFNVEVVNRYEQFMLNTAEEAVQYVERVGSPNCKILLDTFHMNIEEDSFRGAIKTAGERLGHVHVGETNRKVPGCGRTPWSEIFGTLREIGYSGAIVMEPFLRPGGEVGRDIALYRDLSAGIDLDAEAVRGVRFIRKQLERATRPKPEDAL